MKKQLLVLIILLACLYNSSAQATFQKTIGGTLFDNVNSIEQTNDGGYIMGGSTNSYGAGNNDVYLIKTDADGDTLWTKTYGSTGSDFSTSVQQTTDSGYIITGSTNGFGSGVYDVYLIKTDYSGNIMWSKTFGGADYDLGSCGKQTSDCGYIIIGYTISFGASDNDIYLIKTDSNGDTLWTKTFGGYDGDNGFSVQQTADGGYILTGETSSYSPGDYDIILMKTDSLGNSLWIKTYGGTDEETVSYCQQTFDGGYIVVGSTYSFGAGLYDVYVLKVNANGTTIWAKTFGGAADDWGTDLLQTTDSGFVFSGYTNSFDSAYEMYLNKIDINGNLIWSKTFGGALDDRGYSVQQTVNGEYIVAGYTRSFGAVTSNVYLIKTDMNGNSGCNQTNPATITADHITQGISHVIIVSYGATITSPATSVGGGGVVSTLCTSVGINSVSASLNIISIYPNPSTHHLTIAPGNNSKMIQATITDITGKIIYISPVADADSYSEEKIEVNTKDFAEGFYLVSIQVGNFLQTRKLIIAR